MSLRVAALPLILSAAAATTVSAQLPHSALAVEHNGQWATWWTAETAPAVWKAASPILTQAIRWTPARKGVDYAELRLAGSGEAWRTRVIIVRIDPRSVSARLVRQTREAGTLGNWTIDSADSRAVAATNAGQFSAGYPWGWLVRNGIEELPPGSGPLSMAFVQDQAEAMHLVPIDSIATARASGKVVWAFQSYPTLLEPDGTVPAALLDNSRGIDVEHRDSRLAVGELRDGAILIALTRFEGLGGRLSQLPFGPTIPEMSALMGALGCTKAVALDGGISGQLMLRDSRRTRSWRGLRRVPLGLVFYPR